MPAALGAGAALLGTAWLLWAAPRGFDMTDDAWAIVAARQAGRTSAHTPFGHWTGLLLQAAGGSPVGFRIAGIVLCALAFGWLGSAASALGSPKPGHRADRTLAIATTVLGGLAVYSLVLLTPSYNWMTVCSLAVALAAGAASVAPARSRFAADGLAIVAGAAIGLSLLARWPAGVLAAPAVLLVLLALPDGTAGRRAERAAMCVFGLGMVLALHGLFLQALSDTLADVRLWRELLEVLGAGHSPRAAIERYQTELFSWWTANGSPIRQMLLVALPIGLAAGALARGGGRRRLLGAVLQFVVPTGALWLLWRAGVLVGGAPPHDRALAAVATIVVPSGLAVLLVELANGGTTALAMRWRIALFAVVAAFAAFAASFGTSRNLASQLGLTCGPLIGGLGAIALSLSGRSSSWSARGALVALAIALSVRLVTSGRFPYRLAAPLEAQTVPVRIGPDGERLRVDPDTAAFLLSLYAAAERAGLQRGEPMFGVTHVPGLVWAVGGESPFTPWYFGAYSGTDAFLEAVADRVPAEVARRAWIMTYQPVAERPAGDPRILARRGGRSFPEEYEEVFAEPWPVTGRIVRLYRPFGEERRRSSAP